MRVSLGQRMRHRREALGLSQAAVAAKIGMSRAHLTRVEGGKISPTFDTIERIAKALRTSPGSLLAA